MADEQLIKPRELNPALAVYSDDAIMTDDGVTVSKATPVQIVDAGAPVASEAEAIAGTDNAKRITPLNLKQVLDDTTAPAVTRAQAWAESDDTPDPAIPGSKSSKTWALESEASALRSADSADLAAALVSEAPQSWADFARFLGYADGKVVQFNGVQFVRDSSVNVSSLPAGPGWKPFGPVSPEHFGAIGDGVTDDTLPIQRAMSWAGASGYKLESRGVTYRIASPIEYIGSIHADMSASVVIADFAGVAFTLKDTDPLGPYNLTADYVAGSTTLQVTGMPSALPAGKRIRVFSMACDPANRKLTDAQSYRVAEFSYTGDGGTTTTINLTAPLQFTEGMWGGSRVPAYTTARTARVYVMSDASQVVFRSPVIRRPAGTILLGSGISVLYHASPEIHPTVADGHNGAVYLCGTDRAVIMAPKIRNLSDNSGAGAQGYGVADAGFRTQVIGGGVERSRHGYTTSESTTSTGPALASIMATGRIVGAVLVGFSTSAGTTNDIDTHSGAESVVMVAPLAVNSAAGGIGIRGRNIRITSPVVENSVTSGIKFFTEYNSGNWLAGGLRSDYTSGVVTDPNINSKETPLAVTASEAVISGYGVWRTGDSRFLQMQAGKLTIAGHHKVVIDGTRPRSNVGALDISLGGAEVGTPFPNSDIVIEGVLDIDASEVTSDSFFGARILNGGRLTIRGTLRLALPVGAAIFGGGGDIVCEGDGVVEFMQPGTTGIPSDVTSRNVKAVNLNDQSVFGQKWGVSGSNPLNFNNQMGFERVSDTVLQVKMRGSDGVTRSTTLTLT